MLKLIIKILKDERAGGIFSAIAPYMSSKDRGEMPGIEDYQWKNVGKIQDKWSQDILDKLGTSTPYEYNKAFNIDQPNVESAAEQNILGYFANPTSAVQDYSDATKKYSEAAKASMAETYEDEMRATKDMYNRLGLVSSTPGLTAQQDVAKSQRTAQNLFDAELMYQNLDRELQAYGLDQSERQSMITNALGLGQTQRQSQQWGAEMTMQDLIRQYNEQMSYANQAQSYLGMGAATPGQLYQSAVNQWSQPTGWDYADAGLKSLEKDILQAYQMLG